VQRACLTLMGINDVVLSVCERLSVSRYCLPPASTFCLICSAAGSQSDPTIAFNVVNICAAQCFVASCVHMSVKTYESKTSKKQTEN
jgi:hypothetical protein